jgi:hypothetical protein
MSGHVTERNLALPFGGDRSMVGHQVTAVAAYGVRDIEPLG